MMPEHNPSEDAAHAAAGSQPAATASRRRLYLVRHGHVSYFDDAGKPLDPRQVMLSAAGIAQVDSLAAAMQGMRIDRIMCSDLQRAQQTARILASRLDTGGEIELQPLLREIRAGRLRDIAPDRLEAELAYAYDQAGNADACFVGGERFAEFEQRILTALHALLRKDDWQSALIVSHDAVNRIILCWAAGCGTSGMSAFEQDMSCLNIIDVDMFGHQVVRRLIRTVNYTPYDAVKSQAGYTVMEQVFRGYRAHTK